MKGTEPRIQIQHQIKTNAHKPPLFEFGFQELTFHQKGAQVYLSINIYNIINIYLYANGPPYSL